MSDKKIRIYFSDFFEIDEIKLSKYGALNVSLINDLPLFIDPFLLFNSEKSDYLNLHQEMLRYVGFLKDQSKNNLPEGLVKAWYHFPEIKEIKAHWHYAHG